jgi:predicted TIM-barrel fold metal-dependent hydrolase
MYHVGMPGHESYTDAARHIARDRFLFASAYPSRPLEVAVQAYRDLSLAPEVLDEVFRLTAARLMKLDI